MTTFLLLFVCLFVCFPYSVQSDELKQLKGSELRVQRQLMKLMIEFRSNEQHQRHSGEPGGGCRTIYPGAGGFAASSTRRSTGCFNFDRCQPYTQSDFSIHVWQVGAGERPLSAGKKAAPSPRGPASLLRQARPPARRNQLLIDLLLGTDVFFSWFYHFFFSTSSHVQAKTHFFCLSNCK